ncbi:hypothetical protein JCM13304A_13020 [Desulfothermus okinawensis JCM 13304]
MAKKQEDILELTDIVEEGDVKGTNEGNDLDKELEELLDGTEEDLAKNQNGSEEKSLDEELNALLDGDDSTASKGESTTEEDELDIDSIFEKLDEDLNIDEEEEAQEKATSNAEERVEDKSTDSENGSKTVDQDDIDSLFDQMDEKTAVDNESNPPDETQATEDSSIEENKIQEEEELIGGVEEETQSIEEPKPISEEEDKVVSEGFLALENKLHDLEDRFSKLEDTLLSKLEEIANFEKKVEQKIDVHDILNKFDEFRDDIKASIDIVNKKIEDLSTRIDNIETSQQKVIKDFFDDLKKELIEEVHRLVPVEAARIVREEIKALEEELEED